MSVKVLAIDLGAGSVRAMATEYDEKVLRMREIHRFPNGAVVVNGRTEWDFDAIFSGILTAFDVAAESGFKPDCAGLDSWGVDYGLTGRDGALLMPPRHYRDPAHTLTRRLTADRAFDRYKIAGVSDNDFNTTYQLMTLKREGFDFKKADKLMFIPQLLGYLLTGKAVTEPTVASTSGFYVKDIGFDEGFLKEVGIDKRLFPETMPTYSVLGDVKKQFLKAFAPDFSVPVALCPGHDTACAVSSLGMTRDASPLYLISGTWSLFGTVTDKPVVTEQSFESGYTNELAADGRIRFLKNIIGMWIIQECMRDWKAEGKAYTYPEITALAERARDAGVRFDVNDPIFLPHGNMTERVKKHVLTEYGVKLESDGALARCVFASMARAYAKAYDDLKAVTGKSFSEIHVLGGGANNALLNGMIAKELNISVRVGCSEASAAGNAIAQIRALTGEDVEVEKTELLPPLR